VLSYFLRFEFELLLDAFKRIKPAVSYWSIKTCLNTGIDCLLFSWIWKVNNSANRLILHIKCCHANYQRSIKIAVLSKRTLNTLTLFKISIYKECRNSQNHPKILQLANYHVMFPKSLKRSQRLVELFNKGLKQLKLNGRYDQLFNEFQKGE